MSIQFIVLSYSTNNRECPKCHSGATITVHGLRKQHNKDEFTPVRCIVCFNCLTMTDTNGEKDD